MNLPILFVSKPTAVILQAIGFDSPCIVYENSLEEAVTIPLLEAENFNATPGRLSVPIQSQVIEWFDETYGILCNPMYKEEGDGFGYKVFRRNGVGSVEVIADSWWYASRKIATEECIREVAIIIQNNNYEKISK